MITAFVCLTQTANAQDTQQQQIIQQVLGQRLVEDFNKMIACSAQSVTLQTQLDAARKELADLKAKSVK